MTKTPAQTEQEELLARLTRRFHKACAEYGLIADGDHILIGLSGGKDSLALVELLGRRAKIYKPRFSVSAIHVRVKERDYRSDIGYLESFCKEAGVPFLVRDTEIGGLVESRKSKVESPLVESQKSKVESPLVESQKSKVESESKTNPCFLCSWYRRKVLFNTAQELGCNKIAFGHHRDDLLETMLMNLIYQGTFATMPPKLQLEKMPLQIIRPLCLIDEADLIRYAALRQYERQPKLCPFEHVSARERVNGLLEQIRALNPEAADTMYAAMTNVKEEYLPGKVKGEK